MVDPALEELYRELPPDGEYVRVPFVDPSTGATGLALASTSASNTWGPLQTIEISYAELRARALLVQVCGFYKGLAVGNVPCCMIVTVDSCVNDGGIPMIYDSQLLMLEPVAIDNVGLGVFSGELLVVLFRADPHLRPDMVVTISGRLLFPQGAPFSGDLVSVGIVAELVADTLYDPIPEAMEALKMLQGAHVGGLDDQRPTAKLRELMRRAGVDGAV